MSNSESKRSVRKRGAERSASQSPQRSYSFRKLYRGSRVLLGYLGFGGVLAGLALLVMFSMPPVKQFLTVPVTDIAFEGYTGSEFVSASTGGVSEEELLELALPLMGESYWQLSVEHIKRAVEQHPWVRRATVSKRWPAKVIVGVDEYVPVARWNDRYLMSMTGELFEVANVEVYRDLPHFILGWEDSGNALLVREMVDRYNRYQSLLAPLALQITRMGLRTMDDIWLETENGVRIEMGSQDHEARLQRMVTFCLQQGLESIQSWQSIDLRYAKGISVRKAEDVADSRDSVKLLAPLHNTMQMLDQYRFASAMQG